ncbi:prepilin-type N-terminal cleavage/methylation domain-containing protein [Pseudomonas mendocina]|nr:prepilin-type N-terminal cleavage/methylation domain-containing protein [Pseudomonas mendocina]MBH3341080.1 prepilin-type N-terminal cleavage/methylation domain-containing protein [Pseudomonas mendocina]
MRTEQQGLTLIELLVALALTAMLGVLLAALVSGWSSVRERLQDSGQGSAVLDFCLALERRFDTLVLRQLYERRMPLEARWLDWHEGQTQLQWVALDAWVGEAGTSRLQRQRLRFDARNQRLGVFTSNDLYAPDQARWVAREQLSGVDAVQLSFRQEGRWVAAPSPDLLRPDRGVRLTFQRDGAPYVCTFALPWGRL